MFFYIDVDWGYQLLESKARVTISYQNTFRDLMAFCFYHYLRSPVVIGVYGVGFVLLTVTILIAMPPEFELMERIIGFVIMEFLIFLFVSGVLALSIVLSMISKKNKTFLTEHKIVLSEEVFIEETAYAKTEQKWAIVQKLARNRNYLFIYTAQHMGHVVPRRAFPNEADWNAFYNFCKQRAQAYGSA